jgi:carotenoid cleavage dioxygenase-like enzyme
MTDKIAFGATYAPFGAEVDVHDCCADGVVPDDLDGGFYSVGADQQYPLMPGNIAFDGEGHVRVFRFHKGRVDYRSRFVRTQRYVAQDKARRPLMPMYRNPLVDDPSVKGLSRSTANTHVIHHRGRLLALKEDSLPVALDLDTLQTTDPVYDFDGQLPRGTPFTAHPKICSHTGNIVAFGSEAQGLGSEAIVLFEIDPQGRKVWETTIRAPYAAMIHDFAVTEHYIAFFLVPLCFDAERMHRGIVPYSWDGRQQSYLGVLRRNGDGRDLRWVATPTCGGSHTLGSFDDGGVLYFDREISPSNPYVVVTNRDGSAYDAQGGTSYLHRIRLDLNRKDASVEIEQLYPLIAPLPRQDDRYQTVPYRYGFMGCPSLEDPVRWKPVCYARVDHQTREFVLWKAPPNVSLGEPVFVPRRQGAREGEGYLLGVGWHHDEALRSDLYIFDAERVGEGPVATVHLPVQAAPQIHSWWVGAKAYPPRTGGGLPAS